MTEQKKPNRRRKIWTWTASIAGTLVVVAGLMLLYVARHAEPILKKRVIETLSARFHSPVELDELHIVATHGFGVTGKGLRVMYILKTTEAGSKREVPMLTVAEFGFRTTFRALFKTPTAIGDVTVTGLRANLPPKEERAGQMLPQTTTNNVKKTNKDPKESLIVDRIFVKDAKLTMETNKPGKLPLEFDIQNVTLHEVGRTRPFDFDAVLVNPKPLGDIHSTGHFGPWNADDPRQTPLNGFYTFDNVDMNTIKGIDGDMSAKGTYGGVLEEITSDGETDMPNFSLDVSNHPVPLHTKYHAIIDGTSGDVYLNPVQAWILHSYFVCTGHVVRVKDDDGKSVGHDIYLDVDMPKARIEDMLQLAVKTDPPLMRGALTMKTNLHIPPGNVPVSRKVELHKGHFTIHNVVFSSDKIQSKIDMMSMRAQGKPKEANKTDAETVTSRMEGNFNLQKSNISIADLLYTMPGAQVVADGDYGLNGQVFDFHGKVRTKAKLSQMTTSWKSLLLKPVDPFFRKNNAGAEIPFKITGTKDEPHFGPEFRQKDEDKKDTSRMPAPK
jgi:hypothetical protein